jgi:hypothetical protein
MKDCFAYKRNSCIALKEKQCEGCNFYKTKEQYLLDQEKALERIRGLDAKKQKHIFEKYYKRYIGISVSWRQPVSILLILGCKTDTC